jgi:hypothetical protein
MKKVALFFAVISLAVAGAGNNFKVDLYHDTTINGVQFKAGDAKVELTDNKVIVKQGKTVAEVPVTVETNKNKFAKTAIGYKEDGQNVKDIAVGGTSTHILFTDTQASKRAAADKEKEADK